MQLLEKKAPKDYDKETKLFLKYLKYKNNPVILKGSASYKLLQHKSDFDLYCNILKPDSPEHTMKYIYKIINRMQTHANAYFLSGVIFEDEEKKYRWDNNIDKKEFKKIFHNAQFFKLDFVAFYNNNFISLDCIYYLKPQDLSPEHLKKTLMEDIVKYTKEKRYFKVLKRKFYYYEVVGNNEELKKLIEYFNTNIGKYYEALNKLEAINLLYENPKFKKNKILQKKIDHSLSELDLSHYIHNKDDLEEAIEFMENYLNMEAQKINKKFKI